MKLLADYHVHSKFSRFFHGKNTIEELARAANAVGLKEIAITDHGFKHLFGTNKAKIKKARQIVDEINEWSSTKVLLGIEADIIAEDGTIDVDTETLTLLDILIVGYHRMIKTDFAGYFGKTAKTEAAKQKCTNAFVNAIKKYPVTIVSHLDSVLTTDLYEVGRACREKGAMIEINERHTKWTKEQFDELVASDCLFVLNSDAHRREDVGEVDRCLEMIKKFNIPTENVANVHFEMHERTEKDLEIEAFAGFYQHQLEEKKLQEEEMMSKQIVHKATLSDEMEQALRQIAEEQGIAYKTVKENGEEIESASPNLASQIDELFMIKEAQDFMSQNKLQEFNSQNEKLEEVETVATETEQQPIAQNQEISVAKTPVVGEEVEQQKPVEEKVAQPEAVEVKPIEQQIEEQPVQKPATAVKEAPKDASDVLNIAVKPAKPVEKPKTATSKTTTITRTPTTTKSVVSRTTTSKSTQKITVEKNEKPAAKKTTKSRGGFINADVIAGTSEKKKPASK